MPVESDAAPEPAPRPEPALQSEEHELPDGRYLIAYRSGRNA